MEAEPRAAEGPRPRRRERQRRSRGERVKAQQSLFEGARLRLDDSIRLTIASLNEYGPRFDRWAIAWSGGKDSTALVTLVVHLIDSGQIARPKSLTVFYADTRMELL